MVSQRFMREFFITITFTKNKKINKKKNLTFLAAYRKYHCSFKILLRLNIGNIIVLTMLF